MTIISLHTIKRKAVQMAPSYSNDLYIKCLDRTTQALRCSYRGNLTVVCLSYSKRNNQIITVKHTRISKQRIKNVMLNCSTCTISPTWTLTQPLMKQLVFIRGVPSGADISSSTVPALWSTTEPLPAHWVDSVSGVRCPFCLTSCDHSVSCHCGFLCVPLQARLQDDQDHEQAAHLLEVQ